MRGSGAASTKRTYACGLLIKSSAWLDESRPGQARPVPAWRVRARQHEASLRRWRPPQRLPTQRDGSVAPSRPRPRPRHVPAPGRHPRRHAVDRVQGVAWPCGRHRLPCVPRVRLRARHGACGAPAGMRCRVNRETWFASLTAATREADEVFESGATGGGGTRHWLRECFLPALEARGLQITGLCPVCGHEWSRHDPEDGECDAHSDEPGIFGPCRCGRDLGFTRIRNAELSHAALGDDA